MNLRLAYVTKRGRIVALGDLVSVDAVLDDRRLYAPVQVAFMPDAHPKTRRAAKRIAKALAGKRGAK